MEAKSAPTLETERLILRGWCEEDREALAAMVADPRVMEFFPGLLNRSESDALADRIEEGFALRGFGFWAIEVKDGPEFVGFCGLSVPGFEAAFTPCVEIGWRLAHEHWGRGYAPEAARAALRFGWEREGLEEIVAFTAVGNAKSRRVMEKIGMVRDSDADFLHPRIAAGHPLAAHVLYRIRRPEQA